MTDASGTPLDGDRDGQAGGVFSFWFQTAEASKTIYVDKIATAAGQLSLLRQQTRLNLQ